MSKIGKQTIELPEKVTVATDERLVTVTGPKGTLSRSLPPYTVVHVEGNTASVQLEADNTDHGKYWGLARALVQNMVSGVSRGFEKQLELSGVGYKATVKGDVLELNLGFSHSIEFPIPESIEIKVEKSVITISGADKELVGRVAANIRELRKPEPYRSSGVKYVGEVIRTKVGKKAATAA